jgi:hypothetical protein
MVLVGAVASLAMVVARPASAQDVTVGYQYQHLSGGGDGINYPAGFGVDASFPVAGNLSVVGQFDWSRKSESASYLGTSVEASSKISTFGGGIRWNGTGASAKPFVQGLIGAMKASADCTVAGISCSDLVGGVDTSSTNMMIELGGGVTFPLSGKVGGVAQVDYRRVFGDGSDVNSVRFLVGARFGFK